MREFDDKAPEFGSHYNFDGDVYTYNGGPITDCPTDYKPIPMTEEEKANFDKITNMIMNQPPGNPTEIETKLADLQAEVIAINESIKNQDHVIWLAKVEKVKQKSYLEAALRAIEAITKPKE